MISESGIMVAEPFNVLGMRTPPAQPATPNPKGDPRIHALLKQMGDLHDKKQSDYGSSKDPFANVRASESWGVPAWTGALMRLNDKIVRLQHFAQRGVLHNEGAEDSMMDIAVYALIALVLYREAGEKNV